MSHRLSFALLFAMAVYGSSMVLAPAAKAVNCDVNACISTCQRKCPTPACACPQNCMQSIDKRKKAGQCSK